MKKVLALLLAAVMIFSLCACTGGVDPEDTVSPSAPAGESEPVSPTDTSQEPSLGRASEEPSEELPTEPSDEPTAEPSDEPSQEPSQAPATQPPASQPPASQPPASQAPATQPPASQAPEASDPPPAESTPPVVPPIIGPGGGFGGPGGPDPSTEPSQPAGDIYEPTGRTESDVDLEAFLGSILNNENYAFPGMDELSTDWITNLFPGLTSIPVVQRVVYIPSASATAAALALVQVENSDHVEAVKSALQAHVDLQMARQANYIAVVEAYQNNTRIVSRDNYIMLVVHSECDDIVADFNALF